ncbi:unnamed protein product [Blepharisma stoltei]|uniref:F-box domain-containing protein n=1 Tax=Blepharisma stoltei TaxID=1481888 RepID=A0AAU9JGR4_9CILI|nr:unnamed protein product [Blepharisma stoltei]
MEKIPRPVLSDILSQVGPIDQVINLSFVCKYWKGIIASWNHELTFQNIAYDKVKYWLRRSYIKRVLTNQFLKAKWKLASLDLRSVKIDERTLVNLIIAQPNLRKLNLTNSLINLKKLFCLLKRKKSKYYKTHQIEIYIKLEELIWINLNGSCVNLYKVLNCFPGLKKLNIANSNLSLPFFHLIIENFRNLRFLEASPDNLVINKYSLEKTKIYLERSSLKFWLTNTLEGWSHNPFSGNKISIYNYDAFSVGQIDLETVQNWLKLGGDINSCYKLIYKLIEYYDDDFLIEIFQIFINNGLDKWYHKCFDNCNFFYYAAISKKSKFFWYLMDNNFNLACCKKCNIFRFPEIIEELLIYPTKNIPNLPDEKLYEAAQYFMINNKENNLLTLIELMSYKSAGSKEENLIQRLKQHSLKRSLFLVPNYWTYIFELFKVSEIEPLISLAAMHENKNLIKRLIQAGFNINARDSAGNIALYYAAKHGKFDIAEYLLKKGADINYDLSTSELYGSQLKLTIDGGKVESIYYLINSISDL